EIENCLLAHDNVKETVVTAKENEGEDKYICAYYVEKEMSSLAKPERNRIGATVLRKYLAGILPDYMIPSFFVRLDALPLNANGKVDLRALPEPGIGMEGSERTAPRDELEKKLVGIWADVLTIDRKKMGTEHNFYEMGGHSLKASDVGTRIHREMDIKLTLEELLDASTVKELAQIVKGKKKETFISLEPAEKKNRYALSSAQKRLYILQQMDENSTGYNICHVVLLEGELEKDRLETTFKAIIDRHEILRTTFPEVNGEPVQKIHDTVEFTMENYETGTAEPRSMWPSEVLQRQIERFLRPFVLTSAPLLRVGLAKIKTTPLKTGEQESHLLMVDMHHIVSDGSSGGIFMKEFMEIYSGMELPPLRFQYKDYSQWQQKQQQEEENKKRETYWLKRFEGEIPVLNLPLDFPRPKIQRFKGKSLGFTFGKEDTGKLKKMALENGATLYMVLVTIFNIMLAKVSNQDDIVIGSPIAGRGHVDLAKIMGMFVNTLALRNYPGGEKTIREFLSEVNRSVLEAFDNQEYPFEDLVDNVAVNRDAGRNPLFDVMFNHQTPDTPEVEIPGLKLIPYEYERE
ncbi:MAG: non-ribosomal peptide synthetase, partial [bacterium]|nr:non-ribosomal peptide synthetase [bacterium]